MERKLLGLADDESNRGRINEKGRLKTEFSGFRRPFIVRFRLKTVKYPF